VSRAHGIGGEVKVAVTTDNPERFVPGAVLHGERMGTGLRQAQDQDPERQRLEIRSVRGMEGRPIVAFAGIETREAAENLRGLVLQVPANDLPELEDGEYYSFDLVGLEVRAVGGFGSLGRVAEVLESPAHDILAVDLEKGGELLVPFTHEIVPIVDLRAGFVVVEVGRVTTEDAE